MHELFEGLRLRWVCKVLGFDRVVVKNDSLKLFFLRNHRSAFYESPMFAKMLAMLGNEGKAMSLQLKQSRTNLIVIKSGVTSLREAHDVLEEIKSLVIDAKPVTNAETA